MPRLLGALLVGLAAAAAAQAHALYLVPDPADATKLVVVFSDDLAPDANIKDATWKKIDGLKLTARSADGTTADVKWERGNHCLKATVPAGAWVESPLKLVGAAEWAGANRRRAPIAGRLTAQMPETADDLIARGAAFGPCEPYLGIPWKLLSRHKHWLVGDGFSGQFRLAASILRPRRITFLDDGSNALALADTLVGRRPFARPGVTERGLTTRVAPFALDQIAGRGRAGRRARRRP